MKRIKFLILLSVLSLNACELIKVKEETNTKAKKQLPIAKAGEKHLYPKDIEGIIPNNASVSDSSNIVDRYVKTWIRKQLLISEASRTIDFNEPELERKILDYRYALMIYEFEKYYVNKELSKEVSETEIEAYYKEHPDNFILKQNIIQGKFVKLPLQVPNLAHFKKLFEQYEEGTEEEVDEIKSYCYRFASFYSLEDSVWLDFGEVAQNTPWASISDKGALLKKNSWLESSDEQYHYFLNIENYKISNQEAPLEFVKDQITNIIINKRKVALSKQLEENIYKRATENNDFEIFNHN